MASPKRRATGARPTASISVWHWFHRRDRSDTACCIGRVSELRTSLTSPINSTLMHLAGETQALTWPKWQQPQGIARSRKKWPRTSKHDQSPGEVLQFPPDHSFRSRADDQRERRAALSRQTRCAVLRSTDFPIHLGVRPYRAHTRMNRQFRTTGVEHSVDAARHVSGNGIVAIATDTLPIRVCPPDFAEATFPIGLLHLILISQPGTTPGELGSLDAVTADYPDKSVSEYFLTSATLRTRGGICWPAIDLVSRQELTRVRQISKHPQSSNLFRSSVSLENQGSPSGCDPIGARAS
jgi:hypothetical protein